MPHTPRSEELGQGAAGAGEALAPGPQDSWEVRLWELCCFVPCPGPVSFLLKLRSHMRQGEVLGTCVDGRDRRGPQHSIPALCGTQGDMNM